ncbi:MAG: NADH-quinone oxidoreductase subunit H [Candidatus Gastranaerophilales bacterium]|nr:NADH-quinone oxidoreductase subunit H [Candidatus Gastranaerophilales bacterium]
MDKNTLFINIFNILILLIAPFIVIGIIKKTKAFWAGRKGVSIWQPLWDFIRLFKKDQVISSTTSWIFRFSPIVVFATTIFAGLFAPMLGGYSIINIEGAFIIFSYILGLGKFFALISAMDTGSSFEGMGASREACFTTIVEPAFFIILASVIALTGNYSFKGLSMILSSADAFGILIAFLAVLALFVMLVTECSRVPVDDPTTHLELTMIHEVMILDNSGQDLAVITWAAGIKMVILEALIANFIIPANLSIGLAAGLFILVLALIAVILGTLESAIARLRMSHVFEFIFAMTSFALIILSLVAIKIYGS